MKTLFLKRRVLFFQIVISILFMESNTLFSQEQVILTTHNLCPYGCYPEGSDINQIADNSFSGIAVDVVRQVFEKMEIDLIVKVVPWERAQIMVQDGFADGFFAGSQKNSRDEYALMSAVIAEQNWNWYLLKTNVLDPANSSFKEEATVAGFIGSNMLNWMKENNYNIQGEPLDSEHLLQMLIYGRVDAIMANNYVMDYILVRNNAVDKVKISLNKNMPLGVYFSKDFLEKYPDFLTIFNDLVPEFR